MAALLVRKPWNLTRDQLRKVDDWYVVNVLFRPGECKSAKEGVYFPIPNEERDARRKAERLLPGNFRAMFFEHWRRHLKDEAAVVERWREYLRRNPQLAVQEGDDGPTANDSAEPEA